MKESHFYVTGIALSQFILGAEALGIDGRAVLSKVGLGDEHLTPTARVPEPKYEMALLQLSLAGDSDTLGADVGQQLMPSLYGVLTSVLLNSPTVGEALQNIVDFQALASGNCGGVEYTLSESNAVFSISMTHQNALARRMVSECVISLFCGMLKLISGKRGLVPEVVYLEHDAYSERACRHFETIIGCPVEFGKGPSRMVIGLQEHQLPIYGQGGEVLQVARQIAQKQLESLDKRSSSVEMIKWHTRELMIKGVPRREIVADRMSISPSTLDRRLKDADMSWQELIDGLRVKLCVDYLSDSKLSVADIADKLGFSDVRAFQRRFKVWTGMTPSDFRKKRVNALNNL